MMARYWWLFLVITALPALGAAQGTCQPSSLGEPCAQGGVATQAHNEPMLNLGAGNPIHLITGNKYQQELDLPAGPGAPQLEIVRHYNALDRRASVLGQGWALSYSTRLFYVGGQWQIVQADGSRIRFTRLAGSPRANRHGRLEAAGQQWVWTWPTGQKMRFDSHGRLIHIAFNDGIALDLERNAQAGPLKGTLSRIIGAGQSTLSFGYRLVGKHAYISHIDSPMGRFQYDYEPVPAPDGLSELPGLPASSVSSTPTSIITVARDPSDPKDLNSPSTPPLPSSHALRLTRVTRPDGMQKRYLYEPQYQSGNPLALTGIEIVTTDHKHKDRINTWAYDKQGRATLSIKGGPLSANGKVSVDYVRRPTAQHDGLTITTNAMGQETRFHTALKGGRYVLLKAVGAACPGCAAPNSRARYDRQGRLASVNELKIVRDPAGAIKQLMPSVSGWPGLVLNYQQGTGRRTSWSSTLTGTESIAYNRLHPISRRFANGDVWQYDYDDSGRPVQLLEKKGPHAWQTTLQWRGRLLVRVEHPHENESMEYDEKQRLAKRTVDRVSAVSIGRLRYTESYEYDQENRLTVHRLPEGGMLKYQWNKQGRLAQINWTDVQGQVHEVIKSTAQLPGYTYGNGVHLSVELAGGQAARLMLTDNQGLIGAEHRNYDAHGRLQQEQHFVPSQKHAETWRYAYTVDSRLAGAHRVLGRADVVANISAAMAPGTMPVSARKVSGPDRAASDTDGISKISDISGISNISTTPHTSDTLDSDAIWYAWRRDGSLAARRIHGTTVKPAIKRDASGLPLSFHDYSLRYGPNRRLVEVRRGGAPLDTYQHNAFGQRITRRSPLSRVDYFYSGNQLVAESRLDLSPPTPASVPPNTLPPALSPGIDQRTLPDPALVPAISRRYIYAHHVLVGIIDYPPVPDQPGTGRSNPNANAGTTGANTHSHSEGAVIRPALYAVHCDLLGAPRMITDAWQQIRWLASYTPTGAASRVAGDLTLDVRLPGQLFDASTGWHDNLLRTYAPELGHYIEPDPLGPIPANQALGYANQQPKRYVDPTGLLLFAFDGTRNTAQSLTNVWKMSRQYQDGPVFYQAGPGNPGSLDWDAITAYSAPTIIEAQWQSLLNELAQPTRSSDTIPIDIIGFSRGAALARHFGNDIHRHVRNGVFSYTDAVLGTITACVDLRFMGLFDTVAQFGLVGTQNSNYDLSIASAWEWVAHAVALQERRWLFPLTAAADNQGGNIIEAPFIGSHSDIGGGVSFDKNGLKSSNGDLSDVALNWMLWQARAASLRFDTADADERETTEPILHDLRASLLRSAQNGDRSVDAANGTLLLNYQDDHERLGQSQRDSTEKIIQRIDQWRRSDTAEVGTVNMDGYAQWLHDELGWQALPA